MGRAVAQSRAARWSNLCADQHLTIDYCTSALTDLPVLGTGQIVVGGNG